MQYRCPGVNQAFDAIVRDFANRSIPLIATDTRNGQVLQVAEPVLLTYEDPTQRVLFNSGRDCNPFFHVAETLWMLNGNNNVDYLTYFNPRMAEYSDDGTTLHGAYGFRWREYFGYDQLEWIIDELAANPTSRRCVLQMWDGGRTEFVLDRNSQGHLMNTGTWEAIQGTGDLYIATHGGLDVPCNISAMFLVNNGKLDMTVCNRSNDACLVGETKFRSPEGDTSIEELATKFQTEKGFKFPVYAIDTVTGAQDLSWMSNAWKTGTKPVLKIGFDDGSFVRITGDHVLFKKTKMFEGKKCVGLKIEEKMACEFEVGDRVLAELPEKSKCRSGTHIKVKKNLFKNTGYANMVHEHREYWKFITNEEIGDNDVHHEDENGRNNKFENLSKLSRSEHTRHHALKSNANYKMSPQALADRAEKGASKLRGVSREFTEEHRKKLSISASKRVIERGPNGQFLTDGNHKIVSIEKDGVETVYDFTVPGRHNAVLSNGVVVHNCWGMLGANVVHFSFLQEYMAAAIGVPMGVYHQFTNNLHVYTERFDPDKWLSPVNKYQAPTSYAIEWDSRQFIPLVYKRNKFDSQVAHFVENAEGCPGFTDTTYDEPFLVHVAKPMFKAFALHKARNYELALKTCDRILSVDWRVASYNWIKKRQLMWEDKQAKDKGEVVEQL